MSYLEHVLTVDNTVKEVKLFGLGEPLLQRYNDLFWKFFEEDEHLARRRSLISLLWGLVASASYYVAYAWIIFASYSGRKTSFFIIHRLPWRANPEPRSLSPLTNCSASFVWSNIRQKSTPHGFPPSRRLWFICVPQGFLGVS